MKLLFLTIILLFSTINQTQTAYCHLYYNNPSTSRNFNNLASPISPYTSYESTNFYINCPISFLVTDVTVARLRGAVSNLYYYGFILRAPNGNGLWLYYYEDRCQVSSFDIGFHDSSNILTSAGSAGCGSMTDRNYRKPYTALSYFDNYQANGNWNIEVRNFYNYSVGHFNELSIYVTDGVYLKDVLIRREIVPICEDDDCFTYYIRNSYSTVYYPAHPADAYHYYYRLSAGTPTFGEIPLAGINEVDTYFRPYVIDPTTKKSKGGYYLAWDIAYASDACDSYGYINTSYVKAHIQFFSCPREAYAYFEWRKSEKNDIALILQIGAATPTYELKGSTHFGSTAELEQVFYGNKSACSKCGGYVNTSVPPCA